LKAAKRLLRYLAGVASSGLRYKASQLRSGGDIQLQVYADSNWAQDEDRRSRSGYVILAAGAPVDWRSTKQKIVSLSTAEAEYCALADACRALLALLNFLDEVGIKVKTPVDVYCDSRSGKAIAESPGLKRRSKHIAIRHHFVRDLVAEGRIKLRHIPSEENVADLLTKPLGKTLFSRHAGVLMVKHGVRGGGVEG
jgi:hypothetical protein